jgi:hypothetical protein
MNKKMKNQIKEVKIQGTYDYDIFKFYQSNRPPEHWPKIANSIEKKDLTHYKPILVGRKYHIIDGQGRFMACKKLNKPIYYILGHDLEEEDIILLNMGQENWTPYNFLNFYVDKGKPDYIALLAVLNECDNLRLSNIIGSIWQSSRRTASGASRSSLHAFKSGYYHFPEEAVKKTRLVSKVLKVIQQNVPPHEFRRKGSLISAISSIVVQEVDVERLIEQLTKYSHMFTAQGDLVHYKRHLEHLYNYRKREKLAFTYL